MVAEFNRAYALKYDYNMDDFNEPVYALRPKLAFAFGSTDFMGSATRWTF